MKNPCKDLSCFEDGPRHFHAIFIMILARIHLDPCTRRMKLLQIPRQFLKMLWKGQMGFMGFWSLTPSKKEPVRLPTLPESKWKNII
jgi:hypothetical protein